MYGGLTFRTSARRIAFQARHMAQQARRPETLAFLPALTLAAFWLGGEHLLLSVALGLPAVFALAGGFSGPAADHAPIAATDGLTGLALRAGAIQTLDDVFATADQTGRTTCCFVVMLDEVEEIAERYGNAAMTHILQRTGERIRSVLRSADTAARLDGATFAVALGPVQRADLEAMLQLAARLQSATNAPISLDATTIYLSSSVGFCLASRTPAATGQAMLESAEAAAAEARRNGPSAIRSFTVELQRAQSDRHSLRGEIEAALDHGQIIAHFQPQVSTDTGEVTGFEALARWHHPERGILSPGDFLADLRAAGLSERLSEVMVFQSLTALRDWDRAGLNIPTVAVNFSTDDLRNPKLADKLKWELDRFDLATGRLTVEILENVVSDSPTDVIVRNIAALAALGCGIDLDDFGTGHASITSIRRFAVSRIKIDRSFVTRVDEDREQQKMIAAILSMAERLGLQTLAEGVETIGEHAMLAQLGCGHVQGFSLGHPMPYEQTLAWIARHRARLTQTPRLTHRSNGT